MPATALQSPEPGGGKWGRKGRGPAAGQSRRHRPWGVGNLGRDRKGEGARRGVTAPRDGEGRGDTAGTDGTRGGGSAGDAPRGAGSPDPCGARRAAPPR